MGKLLSLLARDDSNCCSPQQKYDVFLDFENAQPSASEEVTWREVEAVLRRAQNVLEALQEYKGAGREIREAIATTGSAGGVRGDPGPAATDAQSRAWTTVGPLVVKLKEFYEFSAELERVVPKILQELCSGEMTPTQHLDTQQALVKQLAEILEFVLKFDELKMKTPAIQNDLSYYRRTMTRCRMGGAASAEPEAAAPAITNELANRMSLFYAHATPMLKVLSDATTKFVSEKAEVSRDNITETLSTMAKVCLRMLDTPNLIAQFQREETQLFVLRVMVGLVILYDHVHPHGAFVKASNVDVKGCVRLLKDQPPSRSECLLNALRYTTKHLNEDATPKNIKALLAV